MLRAYCMVFEPLLYILHRRKYNTVEKKAKDENRVEDLGGIKAMDFYMALGTTVPIVAEHLSGTNMDEGETMKVHTTALT